MRTASLIMLAAFVLAPMAMGDGDAAREEYRERAKAVGDGKVADHYLLGLWCEKNDLPDEARIEFEKVLAASPDHEGARRALGFEKHQSRWLSHDQAMRARGLVLHEGRWLLPEEVHRLLLPANEKELLKKEQARARKLLKAMRAGGRADRLARTAMESIADRHKVEPLAFALRYPEESIRVYAAEELGRIKDRRTLRPLIHRSLVDPSETVREAALASVKAFDDPNMLAPYVRAMYSENPNLRINAAKAVGDLGEIIGIEYLIYRYRVTGGGVNRSHIYLARQLSFVQDFDVEVAQTAFIADPIVGVLQEGQVLDVRVHSFEGTGYGVERHVIRRSLTKLAGKDLGDDVTAWSKWWKENKDQLVKAE